MTRRLLSALWLIALLVPLPALAQTGAITGTVTDSETGDPVPTANVALMEINRGAATDVDGNYAIEEVPPGTYTLRISFVGYQTRTVEVTIEAGETLTQDIGLQKGAVGLDEVVVTGYGTQRQADLTGSIANVSSDDIEQMPSQNAQQLMQGRVAGISIASNSGNPGASFSVNVRGQGSINASNQPLYIVDGVQMSVSDHSSNTDRSPLNAIDPSDIESIEVLKDAAAAAIYGAQAANGVVLITTKSGVEGEPQVSVTMEGGVRSEIANYNVLSPQEWRDFNVDAFNVDGDGIEDFRQNFLPEYGYAEGTSFANVQTTDWEDFITRNGAHRKIGFTANGGDQDTQYYLSGSWSSTEAAVRQVKFESYRFRTNLSQQFSDRFRLQSKVSLMSGKEPGVCQDGFFINCPWSGIQFEPPVTYPYNEDGSYNSNTTFGRSNNMAVVLNEEDRPVNTTQIVGSLQPTYTLAENLTLNGTFGLDYQKIHEVDYESPIADPGNEGSSFVYDNAVTNITLNSTLNYSRTFGDAHDVTILGGTEYRREFERIDSYSVGGYRNQLLRVPDAATQILGFGGNNTEYRLLSFFGSADYSFDGRYLFSVTTRLDGTSRFGKDQQFGFFPSLSMAWRLSEESFFEADFVDDLKVRASYGVTGNSDIGNFAARALYDIEGSYRGERGLNPAQLPNPQLTWEENRAANVALDYALFDSRVTGSIDAYRSNTDELLLNSPLAHNSGYGSLTRNVGEVRNQGVEFQIQTVNIQTEDFSWSTRFNAAVNQNEILSLTGDQEEISLGADRPVAVGHSLQAWRVPRWAGVNPADGRPMWLDESGNLTYNTSQTDDGKFFDGAEQDLEGGFGTRLSYKGLSLDAFFQFAYGSHVNPETLQFFLFSQGAGSAGHKLLTKRWREPGDIAPVPKAVPNGNFEAADAFTSISSYWLYDASYLRLKNLRVSYSLPSSLTDAVRLNGVRLYASASNLLTWDSYIGLDPEVANPETESSYPNERQINFGVEIDI